MLLPAFGRGVFDGGPWETTAVELIFWSVFLVVWLLLLKVTVTVTSTELRLVFTLGWPRKRINRSDIRSLTPVRDWTRDARAVRSNYYFMRTHGRRGVLLLLAGGKSLMVGAEDPDALVAALNGEQ